MGLIGMQRGGLHVDLHEDLHNGGIGRRCGSPPSLYLIGLLHEGFAQGLAREKICTRSRSQEFCTGVLNRGFAQAWQEMWLPLVLLRER